VSVAKNIKLQQQTRQTQQSNTKANGQASLSIKQANMQCLLLIMTILGHDRSKCCRVDHVVSTAKNMKITTTKTTNSTIKRKRHTDKHPCEQRKQARNVCC
jgi:hypothetical protein